MPLVMSGLDYSLAPIELRERLSFTRAQAGDMAKQLKEGSPLIGGCVLISTCNRTELYLSCQAQGEFCPDELLCRAVGVEYAPLAQSFVTRRQAAAARHLMEVAGGLKSQIWGEDQIIAQVKAAITVAREYGAADPVLETLFRVAVAAGKEVKTKVRLTGVATSAAGRAVEVLIAHGGPLAQKRALVIGNGEMGRLAANLLRAEGCAVTVTLRTYRHGETVVPAGCSVVPYDDRFAAMEGADILLSATTSPHYTVTAEQVRGLKHPPTFAVDLALPRDIQPEVGELPGVTLFNVDTLGAEQHRDILPAQVRDILDAHMARFDQWLNYRSCLPAIEDLKEVILGRMHTYAELEEAQDPQELVELVVSRAVDLLTGGLKEKFTPEDLDRCVEKIKVHTAARSYLSLREKETAHGSKRLSVSAVC